MRCADRLSRAKVNIGLKIMGKREDGYHDLDTYFHLISLADRLHFEYEEAPSFSVRIHGNESYLEEGCQRIDENRVYGKSITDPCLGWEDTERLIYKIAEEC